jgi:hypothetical protein
LNAGGEAGVAGIGPIDMAAGFYFQENADGERLARFESRDTGQQRCLHEIGGLDRGGCGKEGEGE